MWPNISNGCVVSVITCVRNLYRGFSSDIITFGTSIYLPTNESRISTFQANIPRASFRSYKSIFSGFSITRRMKDTQNNFRKSKYLTDDADDHQSNHVLAPLALSRDILASSKMRCILIKLLAIWKALESPLKCPYLRYFLGLTILVCLWFERKSLSRVT